MSNFTVYKEVCMVVSPIDTVEFMHEGEALIDTLSKKDPNQTFCLTGSTGQVLYRKGPVKVDPEEAKKAMTYSLQMMQDHCASNPHSVGCEIAMAFLKKALKNPLDQKEQDLLSHIGE
jgi:hypothetical protein